MKKFFEFSLPLADNTLMTTVRLTVGGLAALAGMDVDEGEDYKVCVTESLLLFKRNGFSSARAHFEITEEGIDSVLFAEGEGERTAEAELEDEISYALLGALVDEVNFERRGNGRVAKVELKKTV